MRLIDGDKLYEQYIASMNELIKCVGDENKSPYKSAEAISLLCGTVLIMKAPTIENNTRAEDIHIRKIRLATCGHCKRVITERSVFCPQCGRKVEWDSAE